MFGLSSHSVVPGPLSLPFMWFSPYLLGLWFFIDPVSFFPFGCSTIHFLSFHVDILKLFFIQSTSLFQARFFLSILWFMDSFTLIPYGSPETHFPS